jgi:hypothetical protein
MTCKEKIFKARNVRKQHAVYEQISGGLSTVVQLKFVKIFKGRVSASNILSDDGKKNPVVKMELENITGVELLVDEENQIIQFFAITSSEKGCGEMMVKSVVNSVPEDWELVVVMDWSGGFWDVMTERYPRLVAF